MAASEFAKNRAADFFPDAFTLSVCLPAGPRLGPIMHRYRRAFLRVGRMPIDNVLGGVLGQNANRILHFSLLAA